MSARLTIRDDFVVPSGLSETDCLLELTVHLCARRRIMLDQALSLTGLTRAEFDEAIARRAGERRLRSRF